MSIGIIKSQTSSPRDDGLGTDVGHTCHLILVSFIEDHSMNNIENGIEMRDSQRLQGWEPILERWHKELERMVQLTGGLDAPYAQLERGNAHHLGVCAAIEGYACIREVIGGETGSSAGRLDLALISDKRIDLVECKWDEFRFQEPPTAGNIKKTIESACKKAKEWTSVHTPLYSESESGRETRRIGVVFFTPYYYGHNSSFASKVEGAISFIKSASSPDAIAWSFPLKTREMAYFQNSRDVRRYPGVIAVVKLAQ